MSIIQPVLQHLAIIPDGNHRWAKKQSVVDNDKIYTGGAKKISVA